MRRISTRTAAQLAAVCSALLAAGGCAELGEIRLGSCGNGFVDQGEDCDTAVDTALGDNLSCGASDVPLRACRYLCGRTSDSPTCPPSWACGPDGFCLFASGQYNEVGTGVLNGPALTLAAEDFDGDGRADVAALTAAGLSIGFSGADGRVIDTYEVPSDVPQDSVVAFADLNADGRADVAVPGGPGTLVLLGSERQEFEPAQYPTISDLPENLSLIPMSVLGSDESFGAVLSEQTRVCVLWGCASCTGSPEDSFAVPPGLDGTRRSVVTSSSAFGHGTTVAIAIEGDRTVHLFQGLLNTALPDCAEPVTVRSRGTIDLPSAATVGLQFIDVDQDGWDDLLVRGDGDVMVARGRPAGFEAAIVAPFFRLPPEASALWPLAEADFGGDRRADYVAPDGVYLTTDEGLVRTFFGPNTWGEAVTGDFNQDGDQDLMATVVGLGRVEFLLGVGDGAFNRSGLTTTAPASHLVTGDFDGDRVTDFAFSQNEHVNDPDAGTTVVVAYGEPSGPPGRPISMGRIDFVQSLAAFNFGEVGQPDRIDDLMVETTQNITPAGISEFTFLFGGALRLLTSALIPPITATNLAGNAAGGVVAGQFTSDPALDLILVRQRDIWLMPGKGDARFEREDMSEIDLGQLCGVEQTLESDCVLASTARLRSTDDLESVVLVDRCRMQGIQLMPTQQGLVCQPFRIAPAAIPGRGVPQGVRVADLDRDGATDVILIFRTATRRLAGALIIWGVGNPVRTVTVIEALGDGVVDIIPLNADGDADLELAVLTSRGLRVGDIDPVSGFLPSDTAFERAVSEAGRLATADVDGDGLDDLIVSDGARFFTLLAIAEQAL